MHERHDLNIDPILGLEHIRRTILNLSKSAFYGPNGIVHDLPIINISAKRRGVRYSALQDVLDRRTSAPRKAPSANQVAHARSDAP